MSASAQSLWLRSIQLPAGGSWRNDSAEWSVFWVYRGRATLERSDQPVLTDGCVLIVPEGVQVACSVDQSQKLLAHSLSFQPENLPCVVPLGTRLLLQRASSQSLSATVLPHGNVLSPLLASLTSGGVVAYPHAYGNGNGDSNGNIPHRPAHSGESPQAQLSCPCTFMLQITPVIEELKNVIGQSRGSAGDAGRRVLQVLGGLQAQDLQEMTLDELARRCGCSRRHLARLIREQCGASLAELVSRARLQKAADLLHDPQRKIVHVAMECGFNHMGAFAAKFRAYFGSTPAAWRKKVLAPAEALSTARPARKSGDRQLRRRPKRGS